jgi:hypothetical protein
MDWTTGLTTPIVAGFAGAHFAATALHEHRFGRMGHSLVGWVAAFSGRSRSRSILVATAGNEPRLVEVAIDPANRDGARDRAGHCLRVGLAVSGPFANI